MDHWVCWDAEAAESVLGVGSSGSRGVLTTIEGVVRILCVGDFVGCEADAVGMGIRRVGLGGLARPASVLEDVCDSVLRGDIGAEVGDEGLVGGGGGCRFGFGGDVDCDDFGPKPKSELVDTNKDCRVLVCAGVVGVGGDIKVDFDGLGIAPVRRVGMEGSMGGSMEPVGLLGWTFVLSFECRQAGCARLKKLPVLRACRGLVYIGSVIGGGKSAFGGLSESLLCLGGVTGLVAPLPMFSESFEPMRPPRVNTRLKVRDDDLMRD